MSGGFAAAAVSPVAGAHLFRMPGAEILVAAEGRFDDFGTLQSDLGFDRDSSIAQTLAAGYLKWGDRLLTRLRGDYALVIWDGTRQRLVAARDPLGVRPLFHAICDGQLCFVSEVDQLLAADLISVHLDDARVVEFLMRDYRSLSRSFFKDVSRLPPGHALTATATKTHIEDYRTPPMIELRFKDVDACHEAYREKFYASVRRRLMSTAPVVVQVSGGVDSTAILCVADRLMESDTHGLSSVLGAFAEYPGLDCDETTYLDAVAKHIRAPISRWDGTLASGIEFLHPLLAAPGSRMPWAGGTEGQVDIAKAHGAQSILDGTGGDQLGMPLGVESDDLTMADWREAVRYIARVGLAPRPLLRVGRWAVGTLLPRRAVRAYRGIRKGLRPPRVPAWLTPVGAVQVRTQSRSSPRGLFLSVDQRMRWKTLTGAGLAASIEAKQFHSSRFGLEMAFPFLDWDLVQFVLSLPLRHWPTRRLRARLHREALRRDLPAAIYTRNSKAEFTPAMTNRVRRNLDLVSDLIEGKSWESGRFVDQGAARRLLADFRIQIAPPFAAVYHLWAIASLEAWLREILRYRTSAIGGC